MDANKIQEASKVIAEYMNWPSKFYRGCLNYKNPETLMWHSVKNMKFYSSYDWLISVAKKVCEDLKPVEMLAIRDEKNCFPAIILFDEIKQAAGSFHLPALFRAVHEAVEFVNANKKK